MASRSGTIRHLDAVLLNESWRELKEDYFETKEGHVFMAARGEACFFDSTQTVATRDVEVPTID